jgi:hypothetical protein
VASPLNSPFDAGFDDRSAKQAAARAVIGALLDPVDLSAMLGGASLDLLRKWRNEGLGPKFIRIGAKPFYRVADVREWLERLPAEGALRPKKSVSGAVSRQPALEI